MKLRSYNSIAFNLWTQVFLLWSVSMVMCSPYQCSTIFLGKYIKKPNHFPTDQIDFSLLINFLDVTYICKWKVLDPVTVAWSNHFIISSVCFKSLKCAWQVWWLHMQVVLLSTDKSGEEHAVVLHKKLMICLLIRGKDIHLLGF
jgi:hypothetical protein